MDLEAHFWHNYGYFGGKKIANGLDDCLDCWDFLIMASQKRCHF